MENIKVYAGYTIRNVTGFANIGKVGAHIKSAEISIRELNPEELADDGCKYLIRIPSNLSGGTHNTEGPRSIRCKSEGHAKHVMQSKQPLDIAAKDGWHVDPQSAAKDAYNELIARTKQEVASEL